MLVNLSTGLTHHQYMIGLTPCAKRTVADVPTVNRTMAQERGVNMAHEPSTTPAPPTEAIEQFVARDYGRVVAAVAAATGEPDTAHDGVQTALLKVLRDGHEPDSLAAWVTVVAINEVRQAQRRHRTEQRVTPRGVDVSTRPIDGIAEASDIRSVIDTLPPRQRDIVLMFYYLDTAVTDIAHTMGITEGTVKTQLHRARKTIADRLGLEDRTHP